MNPIYTRKIISGASIIFGLWWLWTTTYPACQRLWNGEREIDDYLFILIFIPIISIPGILTTVFGIRLFRETSITSLKWIITTFAILGALYLSSIFLTIFPDLLPEQVALNAFLFVASLIMALAYLAILRFIIPYLGVDRPNPSSLIGKGFLILMAWQLWMLLSSIFREYSPISATLREHSPIEEGNIDSFILWVFLSFLVPILVSYWAYRFVAARLLTVKTEQKDTNKSQDK